MTPAEAGAAGRVTRTFIAFLAASLPSMFAGTAVAEEPPAPTTTAAPPAVTPPPNVASSPPNALVPAVKDGPDDAPFTAREVTTTVPAPAGHHRAPPKKAKVTGPAPAKATLHVTPAALGTPWTFELTNDDSTPLRLVTDGRLLTLDVTPDPGDDAKGDPAHTHTTKRAVTVHCALPSEVRPTNDGERAHVLGPGVTYVEEFDPRFYCFDRQGAAGLVPFATLVAHLGWSGTAPATPPFVADESLSGGTRSGVKQLTAEPVTVPDTLSSEPTGVEAHPLAVRTALRIDAERGADASVEVTVVNTTSRPVRLMLRPKTLAFEVGSSRGVVRCAWKGRPGAAIAEVFSTIPPHGQLSTSVLLASVCPDSTFQKAGLYTVTALLDTRGASGSSIGLDTFDGIARAADPILLRIRQDHVRRP